ncbi:MAG: DUF4294 domain-containing protein [Prevotellaceae bacterium]|jgi:hypothetical protein|nr:DUF4294 domain-containing protein [Prevotellaceae bacterium]
MLRLFIIACISLLLIFATGNKAEAQQPEHIIQYIIEGNDTILIEHLPEAVIFPQRKFTSKKEYRRYYRTVYNLKKVYPYAQIAKRKLGELNRQYLELPRKEKKKYLKIFEKELFAEFEAPLRKLTRSQGKMLIKLINRETGETSYEIIKELKGGFNAFLWQSVARIFGSNLKSKYDKHGDDEILEELVLMCENGTFDKLYYSMFGNK